MEEIVIDDIDLEKNIVINNNNKQWDKCCFYTGLLAIIFAIGTFIFILVVLIIKTL